jgi:hypothetical protein
MTNTICMLEKKGYMYARTHKYVICIALPRQQWFGNASHCYVVRTLSALFELPSVPDAFPEHSSAFVMLCTFRNSFIIRFFFLLRRLQKDSVFFSCLKNRNTCRTRSHRIFNFLYSTNRVQQNAFYSVPFSAAHIHVRWTLDRLVLW